MVAFASESMAVIRYALFAEVAGREGYEKAASAFRETAKDEKTHARIFMRLFEGGMTEITAGFPAGPAGDTKKNLEAAIDGEGKSWRVGTPSSQRRPGKRVSKISRSSSKRLPPTKDAMKKTSTASVKVWSRKARRQTHFLHSPEGLWYNPRQCQTFYESRRWNTEKAQRRLEDAGRGTVRNLRRQEDIHRMSGV